jgi:hypothetical protein
MLCDWQYEYSGHANLTKVELHPKCSCGLCGNVRVTSKSIHFSQGGSYAECDYFLLLW